MSRAGVGAEVDRTLARIRAGTAGLREEHARWRTTADARRAGWQAAARRGELGAVPQELAYRVEAGLSSWESVLDGTDTTAAAVAARSHVTTWVAAQRACRPAARGPDGR